MKVTLIGSGVVGQATGIGFSKKGHGVTFYDIDSAKLLSLKEHGYITCKNVSEAVKVAEIIMINVPTPTVDGQTNLKYVVEAAQNIGRALAESSEYKLVTLRSTVLPSTTRCRMLPVLEQFSHLTAGKDFGVCFNPEFLTEKNALNDFLNPSRVVIGELDKQSGDLLEKLYHNFNTKIVRTTLDTAEAIKYASNLFLATKISFFNEFYLICQKLGLDAQTVSEAAALDPRIGHYGVWGGKPFGGKCLPKDLVAFTHFVKKNDLNPKILDAVAHVNEEMTRHVNNKKNDMNR